MTHSTRRTFLKQASAIAILGGGSAFAQQSFTGEATKEFATLDAAILSCLSERQIAGASLAITKGSKLIYARGFGLTDRELKTPVEPNSLFRIASVSKSLTAVAVLQLVEEKKIELADKAISRISPDLAAHFEVAVDPRIKEITILQCLQHTAGWDRMTSFDPIGQPRMVMSTLGLEGPPMPVDVVRFLSTIPLQFAPGERHEYSNVGYLVLGRIIENISGMPYEDYVRKTILERLGIQTAQLGKARY